MESGDGHLSDDSGIAGGLMNITVENIRRLDGSGNLKAFASVNIEGKLTIHSCRIIQQPNQQAWVSLPQREWKDKDGNRHYAPLIEVPDKVKNAIQEAVLRTWEERS